MTELTDEQCSQFRCQPGNFNAMVRVIFSAGVAHGVADMERDAERYRWLRTGNYSISVARSILNDTESGLDSTIDAAIAKAAGQ